MPKTRINPDQIKNLPSGGGMSLLSVQIDFGTEEDQQVTLAVPALWVTPTSRILVQPAFTATIDHDPEDYGLEGVQAGIANLINGVGFDLIASANSQTFGKYNFNIFYS